MLHHGRANEAFAIASELGAERCAGEQPQRRIEIEQIIIGKRLSVELLGQTLGPVEVERGALLRICAVPQTFGKRQRQCQRAGSSLGKISPAAAR